MVNGSSLLHGSKKVGYYWFKWKTSTTWWLGTKPSACDVRQLTPELMQYLYTVYIYMQYIYTDQVQSSSNNNTTGVTPVLTQRSVNSSLFLPNIFYCFSTFVLFDIKCCLLTEPSVPCLWVSVTPETSDLVKRLCYCFMFHYTVKHHRGSYRAWSKLSGNWSY